jgi:hypothetical protein
VHSAPASADRAARPAPPRAGMPPPVARLRPGAIPWSPRAGQEGEGTRPTVPPH